MVNKRRVKPLSWIIALCSSPRFSYFPTHWPHSTKKCHPKTKICLRVTFYWFLVIDYLLAFSILSQLRSSLLQRETGLFKIVQTDKTHLEKTVLMAQWFSSGLSKGFFIDQSTLLCIYCHQKLFDTWYIPHIGINSKLSLKKGNIPWDQIVLKNCVAYPTLLVLDLKLKAFSGSNQAFLSFMNISQSLYTVGGRTSSWKKSWSHNFLHCQRLHKLPIRKWFS